MMRKILLLILALATPARAEWVADCTNVAANAGGSTNWDWTTYTAFTWSALVKLNSTTAANKPILETIFITTSLVQMYAQTTTTDDFRFVSNAVNQVDSAALTGETSWRRMDLTFSSGTYRLYVDGSEVASASGSLPGSGQTGPLRICYDHTVSLDGLISDVRLFNVDKGATWLNQHKFCRLKTDGTVSGLVDYWKANESSGTNMVNSAPSNQHGDAPTFAIGWVDDAAVPLNGAGPNCDVPSGTCCGN